MNQQLKQRLIGAIVLVSLAVLFVPVILEGPRDEWTPRDHTIPEPPELAYNAPAELPIPVPAPTQPAPEEAAAMPDDALQPPPVEKADPPAPVLQAPPPVEKKQVPAPAPVKKNSLVNGWYVQLGSFSQQDNARSERDRLRSTGLDAHLHRVTTDKGVTYRVLVGPSQTRPIAEKLQQKIGESQKQQGIIIEIGGSGNG